MPQIAVYIGDDLYTRLIEAGDKSKTIQNALKKYWGVDIK